MQPSFTLWNISWPRLGLVITGSLLLLLTVGVLLRLPWVLSLWPWEDGKLSYIFLASILAAIGAPVLWLGWSGELAALRAGALDFATTYVGLSLTLLMTAEEASQLVPVPLTLALLVASALFNLWLFYRARHFYYHDQRYPPTLVRWSFLIFALVLVEVGIALVIGSPHIFPWPLKPQSSVVFGWLFLGAAVYFIHGFFQPAWANAKGQLIGFVAYDIILLPPFISHLQTVKPEHQLSLYLYLSVIVYSLGLGIYYLLIAPRWRLPFKRGLVPA